MPNEKPPERLLRAAREIAEVRRRVGADGPDPIDVAIGERIRYFRRRLGLTQGALAEALGSSFQLIQKYEGGKTRIPASALVRIAERLGTSVSSLADLDIPVGSATLPTHSERLFEAFERISDPYLKSVVIELARALSDRRAKR
jgi:transcriptional regulator with XRE-family HTH domain